MIRKCAAALLPFLFAGIAGVSVRADCPPLLQCIPASERTALIAFYNATDGDHWSNNSGWKTPPLAGDGFAVSGTEFGWFGVDVQGFGPANVVGLGFHGNNLIGALPSQLQDLPYLRNLNLSSNHLSGSFPSVVCGLTQLTNLDLSDNLFTGTIPPQIGNLVNLRDLRLWINGLSGGIPPEIGNLGKLQYLLLGGQLTGNIPESIGNLTKLGILELHGQLTGPIPEQIGNMSQLWYLYLSNNQLSGPLPSQIANLTHLEEIYLDHNQLSGPIPDQVGNLAELGVLQLFSNQLSGTIPASIGNLSQLWRLELGKNQLTGPIPSQLGQLANIQILNIPANQLSGTIPAELGNLPQLYHLDLGGNQLTGSIPIPLCNLSQLQELLLGGNLLSGAIPVQIGNLANLHNLELSQNQLSGAIPPEIGNLHNLQYLRLKNNLFTGPVPSQLGNLSELQGAYLAGNQLSGPIPTSLGNLLQLKQLDLWGNQLSGPIPTELGNLASLEGLWLGANQLSGSIPASLGNLVHLQRLDLVDNQLSGEIPSALGNLGSLYRLELAANKLSGEIPASLANLPLDPSEYGTPNGFIGWNAVHTANPALRDFLSTIDPNWEATQTVAPTDVQAEGHSHTSVLVSWTPILYTDGPGGYEVFYSTSSGDPSPSLAGTTEDKTKTSYEVNGLTPDTTYYFTVRTVTYPHDLGGAYYRNTVESEPSAEVSAKPGCPDSLSVSPETLDGAWVGVPFSASLYVSNGTPPYNYAVTSGSLPGWLNLSPQGLLSGLPDGAGTVSFTVTATDSQGCTGSRDYALVVQVCPAITLTPGTLPGGVVGQQYIQSVDASPEGSYEYSVSSGTLPAGLSLTAGGLIWGVITRKGSYGFTITALDLDSGCKGSRPYTVDTTCPPITIGPETFPMAVVGEFYNQSFTVTGGSGEYTLSLASGSLPPGLSILPGGIFSGYPTTPGTFTFTVMATDNCGCTGSRAYSFPVCELPTISAQPQSTNVVYGGAATLSVTATGSGPMVYQWYRGVRGDTSAPVGTNSSTFTTPPLTQTTSYWVRVINPCGSVDSFAAVVRVCLLTCCAAVPEQGSVGTAVAFTASWGLGPCLAPVRFEWDFGDGSPRAFEQNPTHTYATAGSRTWRLTTRVGGATCVQTGAISVLAPPSISQVRGGGTTYSITVTGGNLQNGIQVFINGSAWTNVSWKGAGKVVLGGGRSLKALFPRGTFVPVRFVNPDKGEATVDFDSGSNSMRGRTCTLACSTSVPSSGIANQPVVFHGYAQADSCLGSPEFLWDFGDGTGCFIEAEPSHSYAYDGAYRWTLTVTAGNQRCTKTGLITIGCLACSATVPAKASPSEDVAFSGGGALAGGCLGSIGYDWDFGDGSPHAASPDCTHAYGSSGTFVWTLTVTVPLEPAGRRTCVQSGTITISCLSCAATVPAVGTANLPVTFSGSVGSGGGCSDEVAFDWDFGDGSDASPEQNPTHAYATAGAYAWTLTVTGPGIYCVQTGVITVVDPPAVAGMKKASPPFRILVTGSNLQNGIRVFINGTEWTQIARKSTTSMQLTGGTALQRTVPKGVPTAFRFLNPDGGELRLTWQWP